MRFLPEVKAELFPVLYTPTKGVISAMSLRFGAKLTLEKARRLTLRAFSFLPLGRKFDEILTAAQFFGR
jgi:hypothetical protein